MLKPQKLMSLIRFEDVLSRALKIFLDSKFFSDEGNLFSLFKMFSLVWNADVHKRQYKTSISFCSYNSVRVLDILSLNLG
jgi:hypothetical protein